MEHIERIMPLDINRGQITENILSQNSRNMGDKNPSTQRKKQQLPRKNKDNQVFTPGRHQSTNDQQRGPIMKEKERLSSIKIDDEKVTERLQHQDTRAYEGKGKAPLIENQSTKEAWKREQTEAWLRYSPIHQEWRPNLENSTRRDQMQPLSSKGFKKDQVTRSIKPLKAYLPYDEDAPTLCNFCGISGHSYRNYRHLKELEKKALSKESCSVITISEDRSEEPVTKRRRKDKSLAMVNEEDDSAWLAYEPPSQNQELKRMETRILEVGNDVKRLQLDLQSLNTNLDCIAILKQE